MKISILFAALSDFWYRQQHWFWWAAICGLVFFFIGGQSGFVQIYKLQRLNHRLQADIRQSTEHQEWLKEEQDRLQNDMTRIEREARETYGMAREDEILFKMR